MMQIGSMGQWRAMAPTPTPTASTPPTGLPVPVDGIDTDTAWQVMRDREHLMRPRTDWQFHAKGWVYAPTVGPDRTVYVGCGDDHVYALDEKGAVKWKAETGLVLSSPTIAPDGTVYAPNADGALVALDREGREKWRFKIGYGSVGEVAVGKDGTVYFGGSDNLIRAVDPDSGREKWHAPARGTVSARPAVSDDGHVYVGDLFGTLHAIDASGKEIWSKDTAEPFEGPVAMGADGSVLMTRWKTVEALDPLTGTARWTRDNPCARDAGPALDEHGHIYVAGTDGSLHVYAPDGTPLHDAKVENALVTTPRVAADGTVAVLDWKRRVWSFDHDARLQWSSPATPQYGGAVISTPGIAPDGTVYQGNPDGTLTAFHHEPLADKLEKARAEQANAPTIERGQEWVIIGGIRVPVHR